MILLCVRTAVGRNSEKTVRGSSRIYLFRVKGTGRRQSIPRPKSRSTRRRSRTSGSNFLLLGAPSSFITIRSPQAHSLGVILLYEPNNDILTYFAWTEVCLEHPGFPSCPLRQDFFCNQTRCSFVFLLGRPRCAVCQPVAGLTPVWTGRLAMCFGPSEFARP